MGIDIKVNRELISDLNIKLIELILSKHVKHALARVLVVGFDDKVLTLPGLIITLGHSAARFSDKDDFTLNIHFSYFKFIRKGTILCPFDN